MCQIVGGRLLRPTAPGLGISLKPELEAKYPSDEAAAYSCMLIDFGPPPNESRKR